MAVQDPATNPTNDQRRQLLLDALTRVGRSDDFENILELLSPPPDITAGLSPGTLRKIRIGIVGGGLSGLAAAYELRKLGANITIFEAQKDRIGGRVYTHYFDRSGQYFGEFGAMRIPASHETTWHYINLFRLRTESLSPVRPSNFIYAHNVRIRRSAQNITERLYPYYDLTDAERSTPWGALSDFALNTMLNRLTSEMRTEILKIQPDYSGEYASITRLSNRQIFEMLGLSQGAIELLGAVDPFTGAFFSISHDEIMNGSYSLDFLNTYRISGGMIHLPLAFYSSLTDEDPPEIDFPSYFLGAVDIRLGQPVTGISRLSDTGGAELRYHNQKGVEPVESFDYVICTIPFSALRTVDLSPPLSNIKMQAIKELNYVDGQKTQFLCKHRFWEEDADYGRMNGGISLTDLPIQSIIYPPDHLRCGSQRDCSPNEPGVLTSSYNLGQDATRLSSQAQRLRCQSIKRNVEAVHGLPTGHLDALVENDKTVHWNAEPWSRGAFAANNPGQKLLFLYEMLQPEYNGRLRFAGEHASAKQGWMQGALYSGKAAANMTVEHFLNRVAPINL